MTPVGRGTGNILLGLGTKTRDASSLVAFLSTFTFEKPPGKKFLCVDAGVLADSEEVCYFPMSS